MKQKFNLCMKVILLVLYITEALLGVTTFGLIYRKQKVLVKSSNTTQNFFL
jgi:hypothetical protein